MQLLCLLFLCTSLVGLDGTLSRSDTKKKATSPKKKPAAPGIQPQKGHSSSLTYLDVLQNHDRVDYGADRNFMNTVLGYVTPWNSHGYDIAKALAGKFTHISPVWFTVSKANKPSALTSWHFDGMHDVDRGWMNDVRSNNSEIKIVPRFLFNGLSANDFKWLIMDESEMNELGDGLINFIKRNQFDGMVMEVWIQFISVSGGFNLDALAHLIAHLGEMFRRKDLDMFVVVPPPIGPTEEPSPLVPPKIITHVAPFVTAFSVMTYDFPGRGPGPVAPIPWVRHCMKRMLEMVPNGQDKILLGMNFYGYDYATKVSKVEPVTGNSFLQFLRDNEPEIFWATPAQEHFIELKNDVVYYPSLHSIEARLNLAKEFGLGVAIWEIGQGLDYFYNLF